MDLGASKLGATGGPDAIRRTKLDRSLEKLGFEIVHDDDIDVPERPDDQGNAKTRFKKEIVKVCEDLADQVHKAHKNGSLPVTLGGDHSLALGTVSGSWKYYKAKKKSIGLIWVDAHGDMNTPETSPSGNIHGMPLASLLGLGDKKLTSIAGKGPKVKARNVALIGIRDLDENEKHNLRETGVHVFTMKEIDRYGMPRVCERAIEAASDQTDGVHVSFDIDAADPALAVGTGTKARGGLTYRECHLFMEMMADSEMLCGLDLVEVNPLEDAYNQTAVLASELIQSALGKSIF
jgi:arginase